MDRPAPKSHRRHQMAALPGYRYSRRIGVMGGSFNPAHQGHLHIAREARKIARLDEIWWLVSPQNPLKSADGMADFDSRLSSGQQMAEPFIWLKCLDLEEKLGLGTSYASLRRLQKICPKASLIWIMGADNLMQFPHWYRAGDIARLLPVLVMNRPGYGWSALASKGAAMLGRHNRCQPASLARGIKKTGKRERKKQWSFHHQTRNPLSATILRHRGRGLNAI
jgi:nicotinate-nucleotide adenylyltransferase